MNLEDVGRIAMSFPETTNEPHFDFQSYRINGKIFATVPTGEQYLHIFVDEPRREVALALYPDCYEKLWWGKSVVGVRVDLRKADPSDVEDLLHSAWRRKAPKRLLRHSSDELPAEASGSTEVRPAIERSGPTAINLLEKLTLFSEHWAPRVIAEINDYQLKLIKVLGEFVWHTHADTDEAFLVVKGSLEIGFRDAAVTLRAGELFVVPKGVEHITRAAEECHVLVIEPRNVVNTGAAGGELTAENDVWI